MVTASAIAATLAPLPTALPSATDVPTPTIVPTPTAPALAAFTLDSNVWFGGYAIHVTGGTYDPVKHVLVIDATFLNASTQQTELRNLSASAKLIWDGQFLTAYPAAGVVPVGATASSEIDVNVPRDFVVADAVLTFGQPDEHQATVPLNGGGATSDQPSELAITGALKMGKYTTFTITKSRLVPAACSGYPNRIQFGALPASLTSIVLWGTATSSDGTNDRHIDKAYITLPDGTTQAAIPSVGLELIAKATLYDQGLCFVVPVSASGSYTLTMHEYRSNANGKLAFVIP